MAKALCDDVACRHREGETPDFILLTGDLAFSGKTDQYELAGTFCDNLCAACDLPKERVYCIPGNHDIDRDTQKLTFLGGRTLRNQNQVDSLLAPQDDVQTLLKRELNYRSFQETYFGAQERTRTADGLGYVSLLTIDGVRVAIIGLDSAWLAEGDVEDHGKLLVGERQVMNALDVLNGYADPAHIVVGMVHHPLHLLQDFDRRPVQYRLESTCHFLHCGHLHQPEARTAGFAGNGCLTLLGGAQFETRQSRNTYSIVTLDLENASRTIETAHHDPTRGEFCNSEQSRYRIDLTPVGSCTISELAGALRDYHSSLRLCPCYLAAIVLDQKSELPIFEQGKITFASFAVLEAQPDGDLKRKTAAFMTFRNVLRVLYPGMSLRDILTDHGASLVEYSSMLTELSKADAEIARRFREVEADSNRLALAKEPKPFSHSISLLVDLAAEKDWHLLRAQAERQLASSQEVSIPAKLMLALAFAHSDAVADREEAVRLYSELLADSNLDAAGAGNLATLLMEFNRFEEAKTVVLEGIESISKGTDHIAEIGHRLVEATGDREFRDRLAATLSRRSASG
ncbi:MAG: metallophosphoesterase [Gemmatimonadota bacterium]|nr:metallophosphoesterase [Gemmatimonadota bacterium]